MAKPKAAPYDFKSKHQIKTKLLSVSFDRINEGLKQESNFYLFDYKCRTLEKPGRSEVSKDEILSATIPHDITKHNH